MPTERTGLTKVMQTRAIGEQTVVVRVVTH
jgi:hypothetical protein